MNQDFKIKKSEYDKKRYRERKASGEVAAYFAKNKIHIRAQQNAARKARRISDPEWAEKDRKRSRDYRNKNKERLDIKSAAYRSIPENMERARKRTRIWYANNKQRAKESNAKWLLNNPHLNSVYSKRYRLRNPEKRRRVVTEWKMRNPGKVNSDRMYRHATQLNATPKWVNRREIDAVYKRASEITRSTGIKHHVDHIYPLRGRGFVGLHVPWNLQILTAKENMSKGNRLCLP